MKKKIFILILYFLIIDNVSALKYGNCDYSTIARYKSLVSNVNIVYDYKILNNIAYFDVTITNIVPGMTFKDSNTQKIYTYKDTVNGEIVISNYTESGNYKFYIDELGCTNKIIGTKYYRFPIYNAYSLYDECKGKENYNVCKKWLNKKITYDEFNKSLNNRNEENIKIDEENKDVKGIFDYIIEFYVNYYYIVLPIIIIVCCIVIYLKWKKEKFKF